MLIPFISWRCFIFDVLSFTRKMEKLEVTKVAAKVVKIANMMRGRDTWDA